MADIELDDNDLAALRRHAPRKAGGNTVKSRAKREKPITPSDGRRNRSINAEPKVALNVDVHPDIKRLVEQARVNFGLPYKSFVAEAIEHYYRHLEIQSES